MLFQIKQYVEGEKKGFVMNVNLIVFKTTLESTSDTLNLRLVFMMVCILSFFASLFMMYLTISYNFDLIKEKDPIEQEIQELKEKEQPKTQPQLKTSLQPKVQPQPKVEPQPQKTLTPAQQKKP